MRSVCEIIYPFISGSSETTAQPDFKFEKMIQKKYTAAYITLFST